MIKEKITITNPTGLHTRPGKRVVSEAKRFESSITIQCKEKTADLKSLIKLMKLGISQNHEIELCCDGPDEKEAMTSIKAVIDQLEE